MKENSTGRDGQQLDHVGLMVVIGDLNFILCVIRSPQRLLSKGYYDVNYISKHHYACVPSPFSVSDSLWPPWTVARQAPLSVEFSRQEYWSEWPCPPPGDLPNPGIKPTSVRLLHWQAGSLPLVPPGRPQRGHMINERWVVVPPRILP